MTLRVEYHEVGFPVSDFFLEHIYETEILAGVADGRDDTLSFSTENIFARIRLGIVRGEILCTDVVFLFEDEEITLNKYGKQSSWPKGFCDIGVTLNEKLLIGAMDTYKKERSIT